MIPERIDGVMNGVIGVIRRDDRYLIIQRSAHVRVPLAWCFPGGEVEPGETLHVALIREMREELNADVTPGELLMTMRKPERQLVLYCVAATLDGHEPHPNPAEVAQCHWMTPAEIEEIDNLLPGTMDIIRRVEELA
ncbi:MAG TPA: NUDIX domain-containing protein [Phycisphaerae bacterium]|nr:NUDIX domain-containing protein [Phycisphaerae bacterium]HRW55246.1 NUDIX domain-containing protein [Phycisphaerae bacterium]